jgi:metal-sulfur cluster biosynthetic enzyme
MAEALSRSEARVAEPASDVSEVILGALRTVYDPCCKKEISVVDMGLIESIQLDGDAAKVELVLTSGWCPFAVDLLGMIQEKVESLPEVGGGRGRGCLGEGLEPRAALGAGPREALPLDAAARGRG